MHAGEVRFKTLEEYRDQMRLITRSGLVDIMLMSASSNHALDVPRAAVRRFAGHARGARQRHHRHPPGPGRSLPRAARRSRSAPPASTTSSAAISIASPRRACHRRRTWASTASRSTTTSTTTSKRSNGSTSFAKRPSARDSATSSRSSIPTSPARSTPRSCRNTSTT